jgi:hypothetical protein
VRFMNACNKRRNDLVTGELMGCRLMKVGSLLERVVAVVQGVCTWLRYGDFMDDFIYWIGKRNFLLLEEDLLRDYTC